MSKWSRISSKLGWMAALAAVVITIVAGVSMIPFLFMEETAAASEVPEVESSAPTKTATSVSEEMAKRNAELDRIFAEVDRTLSAQQPSVKRRKRRVRSVKKYAWEAPAETRARLWNIPETEVEEAVTTGLFRICMSEQAGSENDCIGIWQVLQNIRSRSCNRRFFRKITECDENGETMLSVMRRASRYVLGVVPARNKRQVWLRELELNCERPASFLLPGNVWDRHLLKRCRRTAAITKRLVHGEPLIITTARVITWGGRCEDSEGACDDRHACERGLARVKGLDTHNAFWCTVGARGCRNTPEPICLDLGYRYEDKTKRVPTRRPLSASNDSPGGAEESTRPQNGGVSM